MKQILIYKDMAKVYVMFWRVSLSMNLVAVLLDLKVTFIKSLLESEMGVQEEF